MSHLDHTPTAGRMASRLLVVAFSSVQDTPLLYPGASGAYLNRHDWRRDEWRPAIEAAGLAYRPLRARHQMVDGCRVAGAARPFDLADVAVVGEHGAAELLPASGAVTAITHSSR